MFKQKINLLLLGLLWIANWGYAQNNNGIGASPASTPSAAAAGKYNDAPVSMHTGTVSASIPIYTIGNAGGLSASVGLGYHAGGVRVADISTSVGMGWTLNAGGSITRTVRNAPDEGIMRNAAGRGKGWYQTTPTAIAAAFATTGAHSGEDQQKMTNGEWDTEPDVFQYNLPGYSGKFYFKHNANGTPIVVFLNATQDIKIEPNYKPSNSDCGSFDSWIITTPDGIRYHFGSANLPELTGADPAVDLSFSFVYGSGFAGNTYVSSWNLTKIESPDLQHHIDFLYIRETYRYVNRGGDHTTGNYTTDADREVHTQVWGARLKEIKSDVEKIEFLTGTVDRKDLDLLAPTGIFNYFSNIAQNQAKPLSNIKVSTIVGSQQIRRFELEQGYLRSAFTGYPNDYSVDNATQTDIYRLYLRRVREFGEQNTVATQKVHELNYIGVPVSTAEFVDVALPRRKSAATDIWGFYNGKDDNKYLTAICDIYDQSQLDYGTAPRQFKNASYGDIGNKFLSEVQILENSFGTGNINDFIYKMKRSIWGVTLRGHSETDVFINLASDKTPSATHMAIGTLDKITYPMGGITQYEYEPHQYRAKTAELKFVHPLKEATTSQSQKVFSSIFGGQTTPLPVNPDVHQIALRIQNAYIDVPNNKISRLKYALYLENQNPTNALVQTMEFRVRIKKNGNVLAGEKIFLVNESRKLLVVEDFIPNLWNLPIDLTGDGNPFTNLEIQIYANNAGGQNLCKVRFSMFYETLGVKEEDKIAGGLRIKNVKTLENPNATPIVTHYDYKTTDGVSSGVLPVMPRVIYNLSYGAHTGTNLYNTIVQQGAVPTYMFSFVWEVKEGSLFGAGSNNQTGAIGYKEVKVWKTGLGHSRYYYFIQQPMESQPSAYPEVPEYSISGKTGMLLREEHFNQNNQMVSQTTFDYIESMPNAPFFGTNFIEGYNFTKPMHARIAKYRIDLGYRVYLNSKTETVDGVSTTTDYSYDPQWRHHLPITTRVKNSDGNVYKSRTYYAAARDEDTVTPEELISGRYAQELALAAYWVSKRMLHLPLKTEAYVNNTLKVAAKTNFSSTTFGGLKRPISIETFQNGVWTTEMTMAYNPDGLPISTTAKGFTEAQIFVWNANRTLQSKTFGGFTTSYKYDDRKRITQVTNPNGQKAKFYYDEFGRTVKTEGAFDINDVPNIIKTVNYQYRNANNPESFVETSIWTSDLSDINSSGVIKSKQWIDGLGRAKGSIGENYTPDQKHLKSYLTYDLLGRVDKMFEPFESQSTNFEAAPANTPYVTNDYEASPLGRTLRHHNADQTQVSVAYASNAANEVKIYQLSSGNITGGGTFYGANLLYKTISTDENGHQSAAFTDKIGRTIMTRRYGVGETLDTYVLYDEFGNVTAVIPPLNDNEEANKVSYFYRYDQRNRLRAKKIPSAEWQYFYYNQRDMLALTQDGNMAQESQQKHLYMQYDALGRPTQTGFVFVANPTNEVDNNNRAIDPDFLLSEVTYRIDKTYIDKTKVRVLEVLNGVQWIETQNHYDDFGRLVSANGNNHLSNDPTAEIVSFTPKFYGAAVNASRSHRAFNHIDINQTPTFDHMLRLKTMSHETTIDGNSLGNRTISENVYNYKNQLTEQRLGYHASTGKWLQNVDFTYNVRGWLTAINPFQNSGPIQQCNQQLLKLEANGEESGGGSGGNCT
ncbi:MAG: hypothetical protein RL757_591, partial [Bacteroidota bacterium]